MVTFCCYRTRRREDCCDGQVKRRASHQREDKKQRTSMFCGFTRIDSDYFVWIWKWHTNLCFRALRVVTVNPLARIGRTFCHLTKLRSRERESVRGRGNERLERWRDAGTPGKFDASILWPWSSLDLKINLAIFQLGFVYDAASETVTAVRNASAFASFGSGRRGRDCWGSATFWR